MNLKNLKGPTVSSGMIGGVVFFIVILIVLYYVYSFLYSSGGTESSINVIPNAVLDKTKLLNGGVVRYTSTAAAASGAATSSAVAQAANQTGLTSGGQYSVTMWLSVYGATNPTNGQDAMHLLDISSVAGTQLFVGLRADGTLSVRQGTNVAEDDAPNNMGVMGNKWSMTPSASASASASATPSASASTASTFTRNDKCDILNAIEYQRWVLIGVVSNGRTLDVYIDGKLSRSCVYKGLNALGVDSGKGTITVGRQAAGGGSINGVLSTTDYFNYALTPDLVWSIYQNGPATASTGSFFNSMFNTNIDLSMGTAGL